MNKRKVSIVLLGFALFLSAAGCKKQVAPPPPPPPPKEEPPPPPPAPVISQFAVEPSTIERGQAATMRWEVTNATEISIDQNIGPVQASGSRQVYPSNTTTYTLTAKGPGGSASRSATVNVTVPPPPPPPPPKPVVRSLSERLASEVQDAYFDYDKSDIREDARATLSRNADALRAIFRDFPDAVVTIEGHCDERGSSEYNLGLGDRRAASAKEFLVQLGIPSDRLRTISYGKERPQCLESNEECWQKNRRVHFSAGQ